MTSMYAVTIPRKVAVENDLHRIVIEEEEVVGGRTETGLTAEDLEETTTTNDQGCRFDLQMRIAST